MHKLQAAVYVKRRHAAQRRRMAVWLRVVLWKVPAVVFPPAEECRATWKKLPAPHARGAGGCTGGAVRLSADFYE